MLIKVEFPTIGPSVFPLSFFGAFQYISQARRMVREGCTVYSGRIFRVPQFTHWTYVISGQDRTREVGAAANDELSLDDATVEVIQPAYTMSTDLLTNPYHLGVIRGGLTRNLSRHFADVRDEIICAFDDILALESNDWKPVPACTAMMDIVCRTSNRVFVGLPLCRSPEWIALNIRYTIDVVVAGQLIRMLPSILRPIIGPFLTSRTKNMREGEKLLGPLVEKRLNEEKPTARNNDLLSWLIEAAPAEGRTVSAILERVLAVNFGAIHTSTMAFTQALFDLATYPEYMPSLRLEVQRVVAEEGWTKEALGKMHKIDSFLRESQRINGLGILVMPRKVVSKQGFRFSDGTVLPYGAFMEIAATETHHDPALYSAPDTFDGFRFSRSRDEQRGQQRLFTKHLVTTSADYLPFGHGKHARFFAATELKAMLAHVVLNYDVKLDDSAGGKRPPDQSIGAALIPDRTARVWFRRCPG
ncbi:cytochrome P450 [Mycena latifolia]|nr:cytochrome P450 [Mycena latifolia]